MRDRMEKGAFHLEVARINHLYLYSEGMKADVKRTRRLSAGLCLPFSTIYPLQKLLVYGLPRHIDIKQRNSTGVEDQIIN